jgi:hypothetical protein
MISAAIQKGEFVQVLDENGMGLFSEEGQLMGYSSSSVTVKKKNGHTLVLDEKGMTKHLL